MVTRESHKPYFIAIIYSIALLIALLAGSTVVRVLVRQWAKQGAVFTLPQTLIGHLAYSVFLWWLVLVPATMLGATMIARLLGRARPLAPSRLTGAGLLADLDVLRRWLYLCAFLWFWWVPPVTVTHAGETPKQLAFLLVVAYLVAYVVTVRYAYKVQRQLFALGRSRWRGWHIVAMALILNPFIVGLYPPWRVLRAANKTCSAPNPAVE